MVGVMSRSTEAASVLHSEISPTTPIPLIPAMIVLMTISVTISVTTTKSFAFRIWIETQTRNVAMSSALGAMYRPRLNSGA